MVRGKEALRSFCDRTSVQERARRLGLHRGMPANEESNVCILTMVLCEIVNRTSVGFPCEKKTRENPRQPRRVDSRNSDDSNPKPTEVQTKRKDKMHPHS